MNMDGFFEKTYEDKNFYMTLGEVFSFYPESSMYRINDIRRANLFGYELIWNDYIKKYKVFIKCEYCGKNEANDKYSVCKNCGAPIQ